MKKILILSIILLSAGLTYGQSVIPRQQKTSVRVSTNDAAGADTIKLVPNAYETLVFPSSTVLDSITYTIKRNTNCQLGDKLIFCVTNSSGSGHKLKLSGTDFQVTGSDSVIALTTVKRATIEFIFDGTKWVETGKIVQ